MSATNTRKPVRANRGTTDGPFARASALTLDLLEGLGLRWVLDVLSGAAAAGIVAGSYGADAARAQLRLYESAARALLEARRKVLSSLAAGELLAILEWLADAVADRIVSINNYLGLATHADFDQIAERLAKLDRRLATLEEKGVGKPHAKHRARSSEVSETEPAAARDIALESGGADSAKTELSDAVTAADGAYEAVAASPQSAAATDSADDALVSDRIATALEAALGKSTRPEPVNPIAETAPPKSAAKKSAKPAAKKGRAKRSPKSKAAIATAPTSSQEKTARAQAPQSSAKLGDGSEIAVDKRPVVDTAGTMFIGSVPSRETIEPPLQRASSMSSKPNAMSAYLAKNPAADSKTGTRRRRRRTQSPD